MKNQGPSMENPKLDISEADRLRSEMAEQEAHWKEAYDVLMAENTVLKSTGSEAMLASQWRQRYDTVLKEKDDIENKLKMELQKKGGSSDSDGKYEMKYRDLKESFRLYRKKAKEIFEAQQSGENGVSSKQNVMMSMLRIRKQTTLCFFLLGWLTLLLLLFLTLFLQLLQLTGQDSEENKLSYLKNLMVNYLTSDYAVREHMEAAIGTVLQFTPEDITKIEQKKAEGDYWGIF